MTHQDCQYRHAASLQVVVDILVFSHQCAHLIDFADNILCPCTLQVPAIVSLLFTGLMCQWTCVPLLCGRLEAPHWLLPQLSHGVYASDDTRSCHAMSGALSCSKSISLSMVCSLHF
jgi:hypothetical protein